MNIKKTFRRVVRGSQGATKGFSLIEVIIGISVITLVITAAADVTRTTIKMGSITSNELIANHLSEEGIEIVRNIRDSNWMRNEDWKKGLDEGTYVINDTTPFGSPDATGAVQNATPPWEIKKKDETVASSDERFHREIIIRYTPIEVNTPVANPDGTTSIPTPDAVPQSIMNLESKTTYNERGKEKTISISTQLTDWKQGPI